MNKTEFIKQLRATAEELKPLTQASAPGALTWNGTEYVKGGEKKPDPYALAWWSSLIAIAELIEAQEAPLSAKQIAYLDRLLFGGMGSLNDLSFDLKSSGASADLVNKKLDEKRHTLFASFQRWLNRSTLDEPNYCRQVINYDLGQPGAKLGSVSKPINPIQSKLKNE